MLSTFLMSIKKQKLQLKQTWAGISTEVVRDVEHDV